MSIHLWKVYFWTQTDSCQTSVEGRAITLNMSTHLDDAQQEFEVVEGLGVGDGHRA